MLNHIKNNAITYGAIATLTATLAVLAILNYDIAVTICTLFKL